MQFDRTVRARTRCRDATALTLKDGSETHQQKLAALTHNNQQQQHPARRKRSCRTDAPTPTCARIRTRRPARKRPAPLI